MWNSLLSAVRSLTKHVRAAAGEGLSFRSVMHTIRRRCGFSAILPWLTYLLTYLGLYMFSCGFKLQSLSLRTDGRQKDGFIVVAVLWANMRLTKSLSCYDYQNAFVTGARPKRIFGVGLFRLQCRAQGTSLMAADVFLFPLPAKGS